MNPDAFNMSIRKFRRWSACNRNARSRPRWSARWPQAKGNEALSAKMTLTIRRCRAQRVPSTARSPSSERHLADVEAAAGRLEGVAHRTPVATSRQFDEITGAQAFFKCENLQRMGAFKFRGAYNALETPGSR